MQRKLVLQFIFLFVSLLNGNVPAEGLPKHRVSAGGGFGPQSSETERLARYLPMEKGGYWSYVAEAADARWISLRILEKDRLKNADCLKVEISADSIAGPRKHVNLICVVEKAGARMVLRNGYTEYDPPLPILRSPLRVGQKWEWEGTERWTVGQGHMEESNTKYEFEIEKQEEVQVPAGRFRAVKLTISKYPLAAHPHTLSKNPTLVVHYWFAKDVGIVKATGFGLLFGIHGELKEFTSLNLHEK